MREIRQSGSEGGVADNGHPYPYRVNPQAGRCAVGPVPSPGGLRVRYPHRATRGVASVGEHGQLRRSDRSVSAFLASVPEGQNSRAEDHKGPGFGFGDDGRGSEGIDRGETSGLVLGLGLEDDGTADRSD